MLFLTTVLLLILQLILAEVSPSSTDSSEGQILAVNTSMCNDEILKDMQRQLDQLHAKEERLLQTIDSLINNLGQQFRLQRNEFKKDLEELKSSLIQIESTTSKTIKSLPKNCDEALQINGQNGIYKIRITGSMVEPFDVYCVSNIINSGDHSNNTAPWMIIQRRQDGSVNFYRNWFEYQRGFGNLDGEFFIGLDKLHALTQSTLHELWIQMEDFDGAKRWAKYNSFAISDSSEGYTLKTLGTYTGDAGDSLFYNEGQKWSTKDVENDSTEYLNCATYLTGAWWYNDCGLCNLNGQYLRGECDYGKGITWHGFRGTSYSLKYIHMAIRPVNKEICT